jgi:thiamine pyrophosphokinase
MQQFDRHLAACDNARLPGRRLPLRIGAAQVGWVRPRLSYSLMGLPAISVMPDAVEVDPVRPNALQDVAHVLADQGRIGLRGENFDVRAGEVGPVLTVLDRGALPAFGIVAHGVHANGLVRRKDGLHVWIGKRAADKQVDPGKWDNIVAGGVPAGLTPIKTLVKEAAEEAGIPEGMIRPAKRVSRITYTMDRPEGLRRDVLHCFDLDLPPKFTPKPQDGEIEHFELWPIERVYEAVRDTDDFKFNVNLVMVDLFRRLGMPT